MLLLCFTSFFLDLKNAIPEVMKFKPMTTFIIKFLLEVVPEDLLKIDFKKYIVDDGVVELLETIQYFSKFKYVSTEDAFVKKAEELLENADFQNMVLKMAQDRNTDEYLDRLLNGKNVILNFYMSIL